MAETMTFPVETIGESAVETNSLYEIVDGKPVKKPPMGNLQIVVTSLLFEKLAPFARSQGFGRVLSEPLFKMNLPAGPHRRPDLAYLSFECWPRTNKVSSINGFDVAPELAIEVVSPSNSAGTVIGKIREYFKAGVLRVWVIFPVDRLIYVYESPKKTTILDITDELDGGDLIPGFRLSLAELFEDGEVA
jgi:Uma2 family endonuclease